jgi:FlaA1/EpsC-like NDP-sugar epimerase
MVQAHMPDEDPSDWIEFSGPRPGEKLKEKLTSSSEKAIPIDHPSILGVESPVHWSRPDLRQALDRIHAQLLNPSATTEEMHAAVFEVGRGHGGDGAAPPVDASPISRLSSSSVKSQS